LLIKKTIVATAANKALTFCAFVRKLFRQG